MRYLGLILFTAALFATACYEPPPPPPAEPMWYWHNGPTASDLHDLASTARDDVWAVGVNANGDGEVYHFRAFQWELISLPTTVTIGALYAVEAVASGDAWAAGGGDYFVHWDGSTWRSWPHPAPGTDVYGLAMIDDTTGWAVGAGGAVFRFNGTAWTAVTSPTTKTLRRVRALSKKSVWAVGDGGTVVHYNGSAWAEVNFPPSIDLRDLYFLADDDGWVVGAVASLYHWDGNSFTKSPSPDPDINYQCCGFVSSGRGWAGGDEMHLVRYEGGSWKLEEYMPSGRWSLSAIHMVSATEGWAVGPDGTFLWYR